MQNAKTYRAICFDLDGTLLPMDIDEFMVAYFKRIATYMGMHGMDPELFMLALKAGTKRMATHTEDHTNEQAFWDEFCQVYGIDSDAERKRVRQISTDFYANDFPHIGDGFQGNPAAGRVVRKLVQKGYPLVLTTMPMFPRRAIEHRLAWAGVEPGLFARITSYENSCSVKPKQTYYAENLAAMNLRGEDVLMVGNNTMEDMSFLDLGADGYLVTDYLLDPINFDLSTIKHGSMADFEAWVDTLPQCLNPAREISCGVVDSSEMQRALSENALPGLDLADAQAKAAIVADAVAGNHEAGSAGKLKIGS
ncbi:HAD family hydrolase [Adlercreutzia sp. ZJ154]|uniref:HAD family hydrolase n=1 Tax=Adlercreutzia sp. ZJ154 TaxID=2709790 RepID=UPI0013EB961B|nr:HAD family hydrolase [Adlercreutzia sp. ZJ154]